MDEKQRIADLLRSDELQPGEDPWEKRELLRRKAAILAPDDEKFSTFIKLMRIALMMKGAAVTHKNIVD